MQVPCYKLRTLAEQDGEVAPVDLDLEFENDRAYVVLDTVPLGTYQFKARIEIDPNLLEPLGRAPCDFAYNGTIVLPRPEDN